MSETEENRTRRKIGFWRGLWLFILWLIRLIIAIGLGVLLGFAIYYVAYIGIPWFYNQVLNPVQVNRIKIEFLESDLDHLQTTVNADLQETRDELISLQQKANEQALVITRLEAALATEKATRAEMFTLLQQDINSLDETVQKQALAVSDLQQRQQTLADTLAAASAGLTQLENALNTYQQQTAKHQQDLQAHETLLTTLDNGYDTLQTDVISLTQTISDVRGVVLDLQGIITMPIQLSNAFARQLVLMQASEAILQARMHLLERNAGLATSALQIASDHVATFIALSTDIPTAQLEPVAARAKSAQALLETDTFAAARELEIIWNTLSGMISRSIVPTGVQMRPPELSITSPLTETATITGTAPITATETVTPTQPAPPTR